MLLVAFDTPTVTTVIAVGGWTSPADHIRNRSRHRRNTERKRLCVVYLGQKFRVGLFLRPRRKVSAPAVTRVRAFFGVRLWTSASPKEWPADQSGQDMSTFLKLPTRRRTKRTRRNWMKSCRVCVRVFLSCPSARHLAPSAR